MLTKFLSTISGRTKVECLIFKRNYQFMENPSNNSIKEIRKTIGLIAGLLFFCAGIYLVYNQTSAQGSIEINIPFCKGTISTANGGLVVCFLSLILILSCLSSRKLKSG